MRIRTDITDSWNLEKLSNDVFNGNHPNGINKGILIFDVVEYDKITVGERAYFTSHSARGYGYIHTSKVIDIMSEKDNEIIFKTVNSTYRFYKN